MKLPATRESQPTSPYRAEAHATTIGLTVSAAELKRLQSAASAAGAEVAIKPERSLWQRLTGVHSVELRAACRALFDVLDASGVGVRELGLDWATKRKAAMEASLCGARSLLAAPQMPTTASTIAEAAGAQQALRRAEYEDTVAAVRQCIGEAIYARAKAGRAAEDIVVTSKQIEAAFKHLGSGGTLKWQKEDRALVTTILHRELGLQVRQLSRYGQISGDLCVALGKSSDFDLGFISSREISAIEARHAAAGKQKAETDFPAIAATLTKDLIDAKAKGEMFFFFIPVARPESPELERSAYLSAMLALVQRSLTTWGVAHHVVSGRQTLHIRC